MDATVRPFSCELMVRFRALLFVVPQIFVDVVVPVETVVFVTSIYAWPASPTRYPGGDACRLNVEVDVKPLLVWVLVALKLMEVVFFAI